MWFTPYSTLLQNSLESEINNVERVPWANSHQISLENITVSLGVCKCHLHGNPIPIQSDSIDSPGLTTTKANQTDEKMSGSKEHVIGGVLKICLFFLFFINGLCKLTPKVSDVWFVPKDSPFSGKQSSYCSSCCPHGRYFFRTRFRTTTQDCIKHERYHFP